MLMAMPFKHVSVSVKPHFRISPRTVKALLSHSWKWREKKDSFVSTSLSFAQYLGLIELLIENNCSISHPVYPQNMGAVSYNEFQPHPVLALRFHIDYLSQDIATVSKEGILFFIKC